MNAAIVNCNLEMTSLCDRACPDCCCATNGKLFRKGRHYEWTYFERAAKVIYGIDRVCLTGGEPTFHPQFAEFVPRFKELFGCRTLAMVTDGWGIYKYWNDITIHIDEIDFTDYHRNESISDDMAYRSDSGMAGPKSPLVRIFDAGARMENFTPRSRRGGGNPCERAWWRSGTIAYADGKVYGCCVAPGIEAAVGLNIEAPIIDWGSDAIPPVPCAECFFSE